MDKVIFDTNAYRYLVKDKSFDEIDLLISNLKEKEKRNNIESLFSPIVAQELLAHLANPTDNSYNRCLKANKALYLHSGTDESCPVFPGFEVLLGKIYFDSVPESRIVTGRAILKMSYQIATDPTPATSSKLNKATIY